MRAQVRGETTLRVEYSDFAGRPAHDEFILRAHDVTHVEEKVGCQFPEPAAADHAYPLAHGTSVNVGLTAMADTLPLLSGKMELVLDRGGLDVDVDEAPDGTVRRIVRTSNDGVYTWRLVGTRSHPVVFHVYDPAHVGIDVSEAPAHDGVRVRPAINGAPTCTYEGNARATVRVTDGACRLLLGEYEVEGALPVTLKRGGASFEVVGGVSCTVEGTLQGGASDRVTFDAPADEALVEKAHGVAIGSEPVDVGGTLARRGACVRVSKISNGKCEAINAGGYFILPDGDCLIGFDWKVGHFDGTSSGSSATEADDGKIGLAAAVGVGLFTEMRVSLELQLFDLLGVKTLVPNALRYGESALEIQSLGCERSNFESLSVRAPSEGVHTLRFTADNAPEPLDVAVRARPVANIRYLDPNGGGAAPVSHHFIGSTVPLKVTYADPSGAPLRGVAPVRASTSDPAASPVAQESRIFVGTGPNTITLASGAAASTHVIDAVDASAIGTIGGLQTGSGPGLPDETCIEPFAMSKSAQRIYGKSPVRPRVSFAGGEACAVRGGMAPWTAGTPKGTALCLVPDTTPAATATEVRIGWGQASGTWTCSR